MRKMIGTILLTIPLVVLMTLLVLNMALKSAMGDIISNIWKSYVPAISYKEGNFIDDVKEYVSSALEDEEVQDIWDMFKDEYQGDKDTIKKYIEDNKSKIEEMTGMDINDETIGKIQKAIEEKDYSEIIGNIVESNEDKLPSGARTLLNIFKFVISSGVRWFLIICIIINIALIAFVQASFLRWIKATSWAAMISGGLLIGIGYILEKYLENLKITFELKYITTPAIIMIICGAIVRIVYFIVAFSLKGKKKEDKKKDNNKKTDDENEIKEEE